MPRSSSIASGRQTRRVFIFATLSVALGLAATIADVSPSLLPFVLALGPTAIALVLAWREGEGALGRLLGTATKRPKRRAWYALITLPVVWALATVAVAVALGEPTTGLFDNVMPAIVIVPLVVLLPAFAEELAWRGYAVDRLLPSMSPLAAALVLAGPWIVLHLLLQLPGQMNAGLGVWPTVLSLAAYSVILTWIYVGSGGSILLAALVHAGFNGVAPLTAGIEPDLAWPLRAVLIATIAVALVLSGSLRIRGDTPVSTGSPDARLATRARAARP
jgi:uncharacterized protein